MDTITRSKTSSTTLYASIVSFIVFVICILFFNKEVLYTAHDRSEFITGTPFFDFLMSKPFGLFQYVGAWLTQYLYNPFVGASILGLIWVLIYFVGVRAFRLQDSAKALMLLPIAFLLASIVDLGYWIYLITIRGYWFSQSVGYLVMLLLLWAARCTPRQWHLAWYVLGICLYPLLGWFALLFVFCLALSDKLTWRDGLGVLMLLFTANICRVLFYSNVKLEEVMMAGFPRIENPSSYSPYLSIPFWALGGVSVLMILLGKYLTRWFVPIICAIAGMIFTWSFMFSDSNYRAEMRMVRLAQDEKWNEVLDVFTESKEPTVSMVVLKNVAMMYEGGLLDRSFAMGNEISSIYNPENLQASFLEIASPVAYYNYGMLNEGFRLAFECGEQSGFSPFYLKMLARCASANGEEALVKRYTTILHAHPYYKDWMPAAPNAKILELKAAYPDELTGVENSYSYILNSISLWYESDSKVASEQALFYSMMRCDSRRFWASVRKFAKLHLDEEFPLHAQEAYILYMDKAPEEKKVMLPVHQDTYERYKRFWATLQNLAASNIEQNEILEKMHEQFGDTYWYFNIFGRKMTEHSNNPQAQAQGSRQN